MSEPGGRKRPGEPPPEPPARRARGGGGGEAEAEAEAEEAGGLCMVRVAAPACTEPAAPAGCMHHNAPGHGRMTRLPPCPAPWPPAAVQSCHNPVKVRCPACTGVLLLCADCHWWVRAWCWLLVPAGCGWRLAAGWRLGARAAPCQFSPCPSKNIHGKAPSTHPPSWESPPAKLPALGRLHHLTTNLSQNRSMSPKIASKRPCCPGSNGS